MRAAVIFQHGEIDALQVADIPDPAPALGEVAIRVKGAGLNHLDIWIRKGRPGLSFNFPHPLGSDAAGTIESIGEGVEGLNLGAEVVINPGISCMRCEWCLRGQHSECPSFGIVGQMRAGSFAEVVTVPAVNVYPKPVHLSWAEAAALPLAHLTAWRMLFSRGQLQPGESVLIHGIGGGVALALLQLAKHAGAETFVTSSSAEKLERAQALGADHAINYANEDVASRVLDITGGRGVDLCLDTVGAQTWPINFAAVRKAGRIVHCGITTGPTAEVQIAGLYWRQLNVLGSTMGTHEEFRKLLRFTETTGLKPAMDSTYPLEQAREAQGRMERGEQFGKIALEM